MAEMCRDYVFSIAHKDFYATQKLQPLCMLKTEQKAGALTSFLGIIFFKFVFYVA